MHGRIKYLVQVQCQPAPVGHEGELVQVLRQSFAVQTCETTRSGLSIGLEYSHSLAQGTFKDIADEVIQNLSRLGSNVFSGVIYRADSTLWGRAIEEVSKRLSFGGKSINAMVRAALSGTRLAPEFYFYRNVRLDLILNTKVKQFQRVQMEPAAGLN